MIFLNESQQEQIKEITANLRKIRQEKSIRIEEIAAQTHIRLANLQALEEWRFEELPEPVFVQGFIRRYAEVLGLDGLAVANRFQANIWGLNTEQHQDNSPKKHSFHIPPLFIPYILLILFASGGLIYLLKPRVIGQPLLNKRPSVGISQLKNNPSALTPRPASPITSTISPTPVPSTVGKVTATPTLSPPNALNQTFVPSPANTNNLQAITSTTSTSLPNAVNPKSVTVNLALQGTSWLEVKADGETAFAGILHKGEQKTWTAKKDVSIRAGNAAAVLVSVNQQQPEVLGDEGEVKEVTYNNQ